MAVEGPTGVRYTRPDNNTDALDGSRAAMSRPIAKRDTASLQEQQPQKCSGPCSRPLVRYAQTGLLPAVLPAYRPSNDYKIHIIETMSLERFVNNISFLNSI